MKYYNPDFWKEVVARQPGEGPSGPPAPPMQVPKPPPPPVHYCSTASGPIIFPGYTPSPSSMAVLRDFIGDEQSSGSLSVVPAPVLCHSEHVSITTSPLSRSSLCSGGASVDLPVPPQPHRLRHKRPKPNPTAIYPPCDDDTASESMSPMSKRLPRSQSSP